MNWVTCPFCRPEKLRSRPWPESHRGRGNMPRGSSHSQLRFWKALLLKEEESNGERRGQSYGTWHPTCIQGGAALTTGLTILWSMWGLMHRIPVTLPSPSQRLSQLGLLQQSPSGERKACSPAPAPRKSALEAWEVRPDTPAIPRMGTFWSSEDQAWDPLDHKVLPPGKAFLHHRGLQPALCRGQGADIGNARDSLRLPFHQSRSSNTAHDKSMSYKCSSWSMVQVHSRFLGQRNAYVKN